MEERLRTGAQPASTPGSGEIVGYGLLAAAVAAGVLYLDGQRPRDIAVIAGAILALLATLVLIAPRLRVPQEKEDAVARRHDEPPEAANDTARQYGRRVERPTGTEPPTTTTPGSEEVTESGSNSPAGSAESGRRAKRGRRRR